MLQVFLIILRSASLVHYVVFLSLILYKGEGTLVHGQCRLTSILLVFARHAAKWTQLLSKASKISNRNETEKRFLGAFKKDVFEGLPWVTQT
jgi:hypothetical protein